MLSRRTSRRFPAQLGISGLLPLLVGLGATVPTPTPPHVRYELAAFGATASGTVGDVVTVTVGVTNNGPDVLRTWGDSYGAVYWNVTSPPGTETVMGVGTALEHRGVPGADHCNATEGRRDEGPLGVGPYRCWSGQSLEAGPPGGSDEAARAGWQRMATRATPGTVSLTRELIRAYALR